MTVFNDAYQQITNSILKLIELMRNQLGKGNPELVKVLDELSARIQAQNEIWSSFTKINPDGSVIAKERLRLAAVRALDTLVDELLNPEGDVYRALTEAGRTEIDLPGMGRVSLNNLRGKAEALRDRLNTQGLSLGLDRGEGYFPYGRTKDPITAIENIERGLKPEWIPENVGGSAEVAIRLLTERGRDRTLPETTDDFKAQHPELSDDLDDLVAKALGVVIPGTNRFTGIKAFPTLFYRLLHATLEERQAINAVIDALPDEISSQIPRLPLEGKINSKDAFNIARVLLEAGMVNLTNYDRQGLDFIIRFVAL
jgi:hypothetical protein